MNVHIISVKHEDKFIPKTFSGKVYIYYSLVDVNVGDLVIVPTSYGDKMARVSEINIPKNKVEMIKPYLKYIIAKIDKDKYLQDNIIRKVA